MFVARNKDGMLQLFEGLPQRITSDIKTKDFCYKKDGWAYFSIFSNCDNERSQHHFSSKILDPNLFPDLKWEDEPIDVELIDKVK